MTPSQEQRVSNRSFTNSLTSSNAHNRHDTGSERIAVPFVNDESALKIVKEILVMSIPLGFAGIAQFSTTTVLVAMVGKLVGVDELGATSLAFGLINATAFAFASGFCGALETMLSYSYGRDPHSKLYGTYAQRMTLMLLVIALFLGPVLAFSDVILKALGQQPSVTVYTGQFCRAALFGVFPAMMLELLRRYFACQRLNRPLSLNLLGGAAVFPFLTWILIKCFGYYGAPVSWVLLMIGMPGSLLVYLLYTGLYKNTWGGWDGNALRNFKPMLKLALPSMAMMLSEWVSLEINAITAGYSNSVGLAAFSIVYQISGILWSLASGIFISAAVMVGNALGQGRNQLARRHAFLCVGVAIGFAVFDICLCYILRDVLWQMYSDSPEVGKVFRQLLPYFMIYHFFDCIQSAMMGVLRGCGLQVIGAVSIGIVYSLIGVPFGILIFFTTSFGVRALWFGPATGMIVAGLPLYSYLMFRYIKWDELHIGDSELTVTNLTTEEKATAVQNNSTHRYTGHPLTAADMTLEVHSDYMPANVNDRFVNEHNTPQNDMINNYSDSNKNKDSNNLMHNNSFRHLNRFDRDANSVISAESQLELLQNSEVDNNNNKGNDTENNDGNVNNDYTNINKDADKDDKYSLLNNGSRYITYSRKSTPLHYLPSNKLECSNSVDNRNDGDHVNIPSHHRPDRQRQRRDGRAHINNSTSSNNSNNSMRNHNRASLGGQYDSREKQQQQEGRGDEEEDEYNYSTTSSDRSNNYNVGEEERFVNLNNTSFTSANATFVIPRRNILATTSYLTSPAMTANKEYEAEMIEMPAIEPLPSVNTMANVYNDMDFDNDTVHYNHSISSQPHETLPSSSHLRTASSTRLADKLEESETLLIPPH